MEHERTFVNLLRSIHPYHIRDVAYQTLFDNFPVFLLGIGCAAGGFFVAWIVYKAMIYFGLPNSVQPHFRMVHDSRGIKKLETYDDQGRMKWKNIEGNTKQSVRPRKHQYRPLFYSARSSVVHFTALLVKYGIIMFGFYLAFGVAGVSVFSLAYSLGIIGLIGAYAFGTVLNNTAGAFVMTGTGRFIENMVVSVKGVKGKIMEISSMFTTIKCYDEKSKKHFLANIPNKFFNEDIVLRFPEEEPGMEGFAIDKIDSEYTLPMYHVKRDTRV